MTVKELIELLQKCPQDARVESEGCDCYGDAIGVLVDHRVKGTTALIARFEYCTREGNDHVRAKEWYTPVDGKEEGN